MLVLAIDQSTPMCSVAVLRDGEVLEELSWTDERIRNQRLVPTLAALLDQAGLHPADLDLVAVDVGPGAFTGIRTSLAAAQAMTLPDGRAVRGVSCGEAIAWEVRHEVDTDAVVVVGDARRNRVWTARFDTRGTDPVMESGYTLLPVEHVDQLLAPNAVLCSPDWDRLQATLDAGLPANAAVIRRNARPHARTIGRLAASRPGPAAHFPPPLPIYLHPAVAAPAR